jgi:muramidase (phage lysozyme)
MDGIGQEFTTLESGATGWFSKLRDDVMAGQGVPDAIRDIRAGLEREGPAIGAALKAMLPDEKEFAAGIGELIKDIDHLKQMAADPDWLKHNLGIHIHNPLIDFDWGAPAAPAMVPGWVKKGLTVDTTAPGVPGFHWGGPGGVGAYPASPITPLDPGDKPIGPSVFDRLRGLLPAPPPTAPVTPPAPFVLPNLGGMDQFKPAETLRPTVNNPGFFSPIAFRPTEGGENPLLDKGASGSSSGTSGAIAIIAAGVRKGGYDALSDFYQSMKNLNKSGGVMPASYETGAGGSGGGAGGLGGGLGGGGRPDDGAGAGGLPDASPAGRIGHEVRRQRQGGAGGGSGGGSELPPGTGGPLLDEISKSEGTRGYNDAFAHQHPGTDLSKLTIDQVKALAMTQRGSGAIGRYQFMPKTLTGLEKELGLSGNEMFTPAMQERLARSLLQRRGYDQWKAGKLSDKAFMHNLSEEWAGLTDPDTGHGHYASIGQDTGHSLKQQFAALRAERDKANTAIAGNDPPVAPGLFKRQKRPYQSEFWPRMGSGEVSRGNL